MTGIKTRFYKGRYTIPLKRLTFREEFTAALGSKPLISSSLAVFPTVVAALQLSGIPVAPIAPAAVHSTTQGSD